MLASAPEVHPRLARTLSAARTAAQWTLFFGVSFGVTAIFLILSHA